MNVHYQTDPPQDLDAVIELYRDSTLGERRPIHDRARMQSMLEHANLILTAWDGGLLVGISRAFSDFSYITYLADLAVRRAYQRQGIGRELIRRTRAAADAQAMLLLLAAPAAQEYYPRLGFVHHPQAWTLPPDVPLL